MKSIDDFDSGQSDKQGGATDGFVKTISSGPDQGTYMFKPIPKSDTEEMVDRDQIGRCNALAEYSFGGVFKAVLGAQAPDIDLAQGHSGEIFLTSKFLENFSHADKFLESDPTGDRFLPAVKGIEKVVITSLLCGDMDLHAENVGIISRPTTGGQTEYLAAKIDRGAAGNLDQNADFASSLNDHYLKREYAKCLQFDVSETRKAIKEVLEACPEHNVTAAVQHLTSIGVDPHFTDVISFDTKNLGDFEQYLNTRKDKLREFDTKLALVESIEHPDPKWKKSGAWIEAAGDPIAWAAANDCSIIREPKGRVYRELKFKMRDTPASKTMSRKSTEKIREIASAYGISELPHKTEVVVKRSKSMVDRMREKFASKDRGGSSGYTPAKVHPKERGLPDR